MSQVRKLRGTIMSVEVEVTDYRVYCGVRHLKRIRVGQKYRLKVKSVEREMIVEREKNR
jgi:Holliday junction resolvasome RuvABC DNA-binding subunit